MLKRFRELLSYYTRDALNRSGKHYRDRRAKEREDLLVWEQRYKAVFSTSDGELVLADILQRNFAWDAAFIAGDSHMSALQEGQRRAAMSIFRMVERDPKELTQHENTTESRIEHQWR